MIVSLSVNVRFETCFINFGNTQFIGTLNPQIKIIMNNCRPTVALSMVVPKR